MAEVVIERIMKRYGEVTAVSDFSVRVADGDFVTFLGPSGCGKTTVLRSIAGFVDVDSGTVRIGDRVVTDAARGTFIPPEERRIGMVFQSYAVWPHMNVFDNVAYPLKIRRASHTKIKREVDRVLHQVKMPELAARFPHQLSGGQQQRVALARALIMEPEVLLLDEPLSNLDAKLREELRVELKELQRTTGITVIFVTHDQIEAMVMSDWVVVMREGLIRQIGTPGEIYERPADSFVAGFIGKTNVFKARRSDGTLSLDSGLPVPKELVGDAGSGSEQCVMVRPEDVVIRSSDSGATVAERFFLGDSNLYFLDSGETRIEVRTESHILFEPGSTVSVTFRRGIAMPCGEVR